MKTLPLSFLPGCSLAAGIAFVRAGSEAGGCRCRSLLRLIGRPVGNAGVSQCVRRCARRATLRRAALTVLLLLRWLEAPAQDVTEPALKAAFIYGFTKFTVWPADGWAAAAPSTMCVLGDPAVAVALERTVKGRLHAGHPISVSLVTADAPLRGCQILYLSHVDATQATQILTRLREVPVLTISDMDGFVELGGIAQLYFENGQLRFSLHADSAKHAHLEMSSKLLALSKRP